MIIDCFPFFNELEALEIRLEELAGVVDWFVLVEAGETYSGKPRSMVFEARRERFRDFPLCAVRIPYYPPDITSPRDREAYSRNSMHRALRKLNVTAGDLVLLRDVDEIPRAETVLQAADAIAQGAPCCVFEQELYYYFLNCRTDEPWHGTRMASYHRISTLQALRFQGGKVMANGGWHFSYLGGVARIQEKIGASIHTELDQPQFKDEAHLKACLESGADLFGRSISFRVVPVDYHFPRGVVEQKEKYRALIAIGGVPGPRPAPPDSESPNQVRIAAEVELEGRYRNAVESPSDIHEHLPVLYRLASTVNHVTELGTRRGDSTLAFLKARPERLVCYDLERSQEVDRLERLAGELGIRFEFRNEDVRAAEIEETDLLFIDTWHVEEQMRVELERHACKARRYLMLHDTETFGERGESEGHRGIWWAVAEFMRDHPEWSLLQHFPNNNGLTVLVRNGAAGTRAGESRGEKMASTHRKDCSCEEESGQRSRTRVRAHEAPAEAANRRRGNRRLECPLPPALLELLQASSDLKTTHSAELAGPLFRSVVTVRTEFTRVLRLLGVHTREDAVAVANACGWIRMHADDSAG